jgi:GNAT superfamily N-acetyltransferase
MGRLYGRGATINGIVELSTINPSNTWRKLEEIAQVKARTQAERAAALALRRDAFDRALLTPPSPMLRSRPLLELRNACSRPTLEPMTRDPLNSPSGTRLIVETDPRPEDIRFLEERLYEFNIQATGISDANLLGLFVRAADGSVQGGAFGWTWGGTCYIRYLFVPANMRKQGEGTLIVRAVEEEARFRGCQQIVLETHDFQAPGFYQKLGFEVVSRVGDYPRGHQYLTLVKPLA